MIEAERARRLTEAASRGVHARDGYLSPTPWLTRVLGVAASCAARYLRWTEALERMPRTREALANGEITSSTAGVLLAAFRDHPEALAEGERVLLDAARNLSVRDLGRVVAYWRQVADADGDAGREERLRERRGLYLSPWLNGLVRADGDFDPEGGQVVISAVRAHVDVDARATTADTGTPAQRRADALVEICRRYLNASDRPTTAGERPHLVVHVDLEALEGRAGRRCELDDAGVVTPEAARRVACDASLSRVITRGGSEPLEVGRRTPIVSAALRRALVVRDGGCRFPGCERPHAWCDAHHVRHWADGGETSLGNLVLLCRAHHRLVHGRFRLQIIEGEPAFTRPDGTWIADRAPPRVAALTG